MNAPTLQRVAPQGTPLDDAAFRAVYEFLNHESDCLGCGDLPAWQTLLAPQIRYRVMAPAFLDAARPRHYGRGTPYFDDDADSLAIRVRQLSTPSFTIAENPPTIARHFVTNIRAARTDGGIEALSNVLVLRVRSTEPEPAVVSARRVDLLVETPHGLRLASRLAQLDQVSVRQPNLSFFI